VKVAFHPPADRIQPPHWFRGVLKIAAKTAGNGGLSRRDKSSNSALSDWSFRDQRTIRNRSRYRKISVRKSRNSCE
jgi:hypothetical protein